MHFCTPLRRALVPAAVAIAALTPSLSQALELTDLPGVVASANRCYLNASCHPDGPWAAANVIDNLPHDGTGNHAWNAGEYGSVGAPQWVRLDFGASYQLQGVDLSFTYNVQYPNYTNVYQVLTSLDGVSWSLAANGTLYDSANAALRNNTWSWAEGTGPVTRFVEYRVIGGSHWATLGEISVQGVAAPVPEPASAAMALAGLGLTGWLARRRTRAAR